MDDRGFIQNYLTDMTRAIGDFSVDDIESVIFGSMPSMMEGVAMNHFYLADALRGVGKSFMRTETCGTTGISLARP